MKIDLTLNRLIKTGKYTEGKLYINGVYFCDTIEPYDSNLTQDDAVNVIESEKKLHKICIPSGKYKVILNYSARFKRILPLLVGVKGFTGIRIHVGNTVENSEGCILVGRKNKDGFIVKSSLTLNSLIDTLKGNSCSITIQDKNGKS